MQVRDLLINSKKMCKTSCLHSYFLFCISEFLPQKILLLYIQNHIQINLVIYIFYFPWNLVKLGIVKFCSFDLKKKKQEKGHKKLQLVEKRNPMLTEQGQKHNRKEVLLNDKTV